MKIAPQIGKPISLGEFTSTPPVVLPNPSLDTKGMLFFQDSLPLPNRSSLFSPQQININSILTGSLDTLREWSHSLPSIYIDAPLVFMKNQFEQLQNNISLDPIVSLHSSEKNISSDLGVPVTFDATIQQHQLLTSQVAAFNQQISPHKLLHMRQNRVKTPLSNRKLPYEREKKGSRRPPRFRGLTTKSAQFLHKIGGFLNAILRGSTTN